MFSADRHSGKQSAHGVVICRTGINSLQGSEVWVADTNAIGSDGPSVAMDASGNFVVMWSGRSPYSTDQVFAQLYNANGTQRGNSFLINTDTTGYHNRPTVAMDADGDFVAVWEASFQPAGSGIFGRRFSSSGAAGVEFRVNEVTLVGGEDLTDIAMNDSGAFIVVWNGLNPAGGDKIAGRRFNSSAVAQGSEFQVNTTTNGVMSDASVDINSAGEFVVAWDDSTDAIRGQQFNATGTRAGNEFRVNGTSGGNYEAPSVVLRDTGEATIVWTGAELLGDKNVWGQRYTAGPALPGIVILDVDVVEGDSGTTNAVFAVAVMEFPAQTVTVNYSTSDGTATQPSDYTAKSGTLTFAPGILLQQITVAVRGDTTGESEETFKVTLSNAVNGAIFDNVGVGKIINDDILSTPALSINDVSVAEGNSGSTNLVFTVSLSSAYSQAVSVAYATSNSTATASSDYTATSGTLTIAAGVTTGRITVVVLGDTQVEANETFSVTLSSPFRSTIADGTGIATITNDDVATPPPTISINDISVTEGNSGLSSAVFTVTLSGTYSQNVTVAYTTNDATAFGILDFNATSGTLTFSPGSTTRTVTVVVLGDTQVEGDEAFTILLSNPVNGSISDNLGIATITNDDQSWHNSAKPTDVDASGVTSGIDLIYMVDALNFYPGGLIVTFTPAPTKQIDVNGDGNLSAIDLVLVVDVLNSSNSLQRLVAPSAPANATPPANDAVDIKVALSQPIAAEQHVRYVQLPTFQANAVMPMASGESAISTWASSSHVTPATASARAAKPVTTSDARIRLLGDDQRAAAHASALGTKASGLE